jgi:hypothetical protein
MGMAWNDEHEGDGVCSCQHLYEGDVLQQDALV